jgi:hypothetical protein
MSKVSYRQALAQQPSGLWSSYSRIHTAYECSIARVGFVWYCLIISQSSYIGGVWVFNGVQ